MRISWALIRGCGANPVVSGRAVVSAALAVYFSIATPQSNATQLNCDFRSEIKVKSLSITSPTSEIGFLADRVVVKFDDSDTATFTNQETNRVREVRHVHTNGSDHFIESIGQGQISVLSVLSPDATNKNVAIWSFHAWGSPGGASDTTYGRPSQRLGSCTRF